MARKVKYDFTEEEIVNYVINNQCSIREAARHFGCGKDTIALRIKRYNGINKEKVLEILQNNIKESRF